MALGTIASIAAITAAAASVANLGYQAAQGTPASPNLASASREVAEAQANALPEQRALAAAAQQGGTAQYTVGKHTEKRQFVRLPAVESREVVNGRVAHHTAQGQVVPYVAEEWQPGGKYFKEGQQTPNIFNRNVRVPGSTQTADFTGYGTADIEGELARQFADIQTDLGAKYGVDFAKQRRAEAEMADPEGFAARAKEYELIQNELNNPSPISPLSGTLDEQILSQLEAGGGIDDMERGLLDAAVAKANMARSGQTSGADIERSMTSGYEGEARRNAALDKAAGWLESGSTPEDIEFRREQQNLGNLGSFISGQTPQSQFANLSGAQQGATPFVPGRQPPSLPANAGAAGAPGAVAGYQSQLAAQGSQANNWFAGMSALLQGVSTAAQIRR